MDAKSKGKPKAKPKAKEYSLSRYAPIRHRIVQTENTILLIEEDPKWEIPSAYFSIAFKADPVSVLKYGGNGLHFAEHILWNIVTGGEMRLRHTNATTYSSGEMAVYGMCLESEFSSTLRGFFSRLIDMASAKWTSRLGSVFKIEQRRVTAETSGMAERSVGHHPSRRMFVYNTDMIRSEYSHEFVWRILLDECKLGRIVIMAHCKVSGEDVAAFEKLSREFTDRWNERGKRIAKKIPLPMYFAPPFSFIEHATSERPIVVPLDSIPNPIERAIIGSHLSLFGPPYFIAATTMRWVVKRIQKEFSAAYLQWSLAFYDPFFVVAVLSLYRGRVEEEWVNDLYRLSGRGLLEKYGDSARRHLIRIMDTIVEK